MTRGPAARRDRPRIVYLVTEDWYFLSHRLPVARAAQAAGFEVVVATRVRDHGPRITAEGFRLVPLRLRRGSRNPWREAAAVIEICRLYARERPDIVHHVALKPTLYGSLAAIFARVPAVVNALAGMGYVFISPAPAARLLRPFVRAAFRLLLNRRGARLVLQNPDDRDLLVGAGAIAAARVVIIPGSGVDPHVFRPWPEPDGTPVALLASRMLWDKGVGETVEAARRLAERGVPVRVVLAGESDPDNPTAIPPETLARWQGEGVVEWRGFVDDVPALLAGAHIAVLPSYREGLPKSLLEAAAAGRPIVASDVPGCREIAHHGENALLVPVRDARALADAIERLAGDAELRRRLGARGREMVLESFSEGAVVAQTLRLYRDLLAGAGPGR